MIKAISDHQKYAHANIELKSHNIVYISFIMHTEISYYYLLYSKHKIF